MAKTIDTYAYVSALKELVEQGKEVSMTISGSSMAPFLCHGRDLICFKAPDRELKAGDMVFYQRSTGQYVMHRICRVTDEGYDIIGDNQLEIEKGIKREQIFGLIFKVQRGGKWIKPGDFWWNFFERVWIRIIPLRPLVNRMYGIVYRIRGKKQTT